MQLWLQIPTLTFEQTVVCYPYSWAQWGNCPSAENREKETSYQALQSPAVKQDLRVTYDYLNNTEDSNSILFRLEYFINHVKQAN